MYFWRRSFTDSVQLCCFVIESKRIILSHNAMIEGFKPNPILGRAYVKFINIILVCDSITYMAVLFQLEIILFPPRYIIGSVYRSFHIFNITGNSYPIHISAQIIKPLVGIHKSHNGLQKGYIKNG